MNENELQKNRRLFGETERLAGLGHYEWDEIEHRYAYCSEGMARLLDTTLDVFTQKVNNSDMNGLEAYLDFVHPDDHAKYLDACAEYVRTHVGFDIEYRMLPVTGGCIDVREVLELTFDDDGDLVRTHGYLQDISRIKQMERDLRQAHDELEHRVQKRTAALVESEARYREIFDESGFGIWEEDWTEVKQAIDQLNLDDASELASYFETNPGFLFELFGIALQDFKVSPGVPELYGMPNVEALRKWREREGVLNDIGLFRDCLIRLFQHRWTYQFEETYVHHSGGPIILNVRMVVPKRHRHNWSRVIYSISDVAELKQAEGLLNQAAKLAGIGYYVWDATKERYVSCSNQHAYMHGVSAEEFVRRTTGERNRHSLVLPEYQPTVNTAMQGLRRGDSVHIEYGTKWPDGSVRYIRQFIESVFDDKGTLIREIGSSQDVTEQKLVERQLRQSQKLEAIGRLTGGIAHDFNNLLAVIMGNTELLLEEGGGDSSTLNDVMKAAVRGSVLTKQLLTFSQEQTLESKTVNVNKVVDDMLQMLARTLGDTINIRTSLDANMCPAFVDPHQLENTILNLILNSRDAMPGGGEILIETENLASDSNSVESRVDLGPGDYVTLAIKDNGHGMCADVVERAFEPFFTTKEASKGSGLGLATVFGFAKQSGGHIDIQSTPGAGTTVRMFLPKTSNSTEPTDVDVKQAQVPRGDGETILLVEDNPDVRKHVDDVLRKLGYNVTSAAEGREVLEAMPKMIKPDLLLSDVVLPGGMNGLDLASQILQIWPDLPVLFMTGHTDDTVSLDELTASGAKVIRKPFRRNDFATTIHSLIRCAPS